jgi:predicted RNA methylase
LLNTKTKCEYTKVRRTLEDLFVLGWIDLMKNNPELYEKAIALEDNCPNKNTQLSSKPLRRFREFKGQSKLEEFKATCEVSGGCFL